MDEYFWCFYWVVGDKDMILRKNFGMEFQLCVLAVYKLYFIPMDMHRIFQSEKESKFGILGDTSF